MSEDRRQNLASDIRHLKSDLRRVMEIRRAAFVAQNKNASLALRDHFLKSIVLPSRGIVSSYFTRGGEMDPAPLAEALCAAGHKIALPVMVGRDRPLDFRIYNSGDPLRRNALGIEEPDTGADLAEPDILLVPLLAFDRQRHRLGAGGGYYDRTLRELSIKKHILAIGIGFSCQEVPVIPVESHDMKLDGIATEIQVF